MSIQTDHEAAAALALAQVQPIGVDTPGVAEFESWVAEKVAADPPPRKAPVTHTPPAGVIARPGDIVIVSMPGITPHGADVVHRQLTERLPGIADVVIVDGAVTVYRPGADPS